VNLEEREQVEARVNATMFGSVSLSYHNNDGGAIKVLMHRHISRARARDHPWEGELRIIEVTDRGKIDEYYLAGC
jgi:hypothetical protein